MENKKLYNKIMEAVASQVKRILNENDDLDLIVPAERDPEDARYFVVGDVLYEIYSYSMTLVYFYKIVAQPSPKTYELVEIPSKIVSGDGFTGYCEPDFSKFNENDERIRVRIRQNNTICTDKYHGYCRLWDGKAKYYDRLD